MKVKDNLGVAIRLKLATNLVLGVLICSIGALCLSPMEEGVSAKTESGELYRYSDTPQGVSLMFNVYWGTDEVYRILTILSEYDAKATFFDYAFSGREWDKDYRVSVWFDLEK